VAPLEQFQRLGLALAIGFLIGVERGWRERDAAEGQRTAGIRTYALSGLLGGVAAMLSQTLGGWVFAALGFPFAAAFILFKQREQAEEQDHSVTGVVAALIVFALGAYAVVGDARLAAAAAVVTAGLLAFKGALHTWLRSLTWPELRSALVLLAMTFVLLPIVPNKGLGPYESFNPYELWVLTIGLAGVSFIGYVATKIFGPLRGAMLGSAVGALISSTAVTLHLAREERRSSSAIAHAGMALLAGAVMAVRIGVIALVLSPELFARLAAPLGIFAGVSAVAAALAALRTRGQETTAAALKSPFDFAVVCKFALVLGAVMAGARILSKIYGAKGLLVVSAFAGLADVDAVTMTSARMSAEGLDLRLAVYAVLLAAGMDSISKAVIASVVGGVRFGAIFAAGTLLAAALAAIPLVLGL